MGEGWRIPVAADVTATADVRLRRLSNAGDPAEHKGPINALTAIPSSDGRHFLYWVLSRDKPHEGVSGGRSTPAIAGNCCRWSLAEYTNGYSIVASTQT